MITEAGPGGIRMFILGGEARLTVIDSQGTVGTPFEDVDTQMKIGRERAIKSGLPFTVFDLDQYARVLEEIDKRVLPTPPEERLAEQRLREVDLAMALSGLLDVAHTSF